MAKKPVPKAASRKAAQPAKKMTKAVIPVKPVKKPLQKPQAKPQAKAVANPQANVAPVKARAAPVKAEAAPVKADAVVGKAGAVKGKGKPEAVPVQAKSAAKAAMPAAGKPAAKAVPEKNGKPVLVPTDAEAAAALAKAAKASKKSARSERRNREKIEMLLLQRAPTPEDVEARRNKLKALIKLGKERSFLTYAEINDHLPEDVVDAEQIEAIITTFTDMGIAVYDKAPDAETLLLSADAPAAAPDDDVEEQAEAAASSLDSEFGRTTDPVRMYMREMGSVELLTREGEIEIAKRIEDGLKHMIQAIAACPTTIGEILIMAGKISRDEMRIDELVDGLIDPNVSEEELARLAAEEARAEAEAAAGDTGEGDEDDDDGEAAS